MHCSLLLHNYPYCKHNFLLDYMMFTFTIHREIAYCVAVLMSIFIDFAIIPIPFYLSADVLIWGVCSIASGV